MTTYFVKNGGSDAATGLSDALAWATIAKVNGFAFAAGDIVQLKRASTWREELNLAVGGTAGNPIIVQDYDAGAKPICTASDLGASWANESGNLWFIDTPNLDPNIIWFNGTRGTEKSTKAALVGVREWFWQSTGGGRLYIWAASDPNTLYTAPGVEYAARDSALNTDSKANVTYKNLHIKHGRGAAAGIGVIWIQNSVQNIILDTLTVEEGFNEGVSTTGVGTTGFHMRDCEIFGFGNNGFAHNQQNMNEQFIYRNVVHDNGWRVTSGSGLIIRLQSGEVYENECYSNGVAGLGSGTHHGIYQQALLTVADPSDVLIHDNICHDHPNGHGIAAKSSCEIYNNECYGNSHGGITPNDNQTVAQTFLIHHNFLYENGKNGIWQNIKGSAALHLKIYNNTFYHNSGVASHGADPVAELYMTQNITSLDVRDNIFLTNFQPAYNIVNQTGTVTIDYNSALRTGNTTMGIYAGVSKTFAQWQALGFDVNGISDDPDFTNATTDFTLLSTSPCIDAGVAIAGINDGFFGSAPDMGALETQPVSTDRRAKVTWVEFETPSVNNDRRAVVTHASFEIPDAARRAVVYAASFEIQEGGDSQWGFPITVIPLGDRTLEVRGDWVEAGSVSGMGGV